MAVSSLGDAMNRLQASGYSIEPSSPARQASVAGGGYNANYNMTQNGNPYYQGYADILNRANAPKNVGLSNTEMWQADRRAMNTGEYLAAGAENLSGWLASMGGTSKFDPNAGITPENVGWFLYSLPGQFASAPFDAFARAYEGVTGAPILNADLESGTIADAELDASQRMASLVHGAISGLGMFAGGSGRVLGSVARMASGGKIGETMAKGWLGKAVEGSPVASAALGLASSAAEEGGEEFAQSYLEDVRNKELNENSWDKAVESFGWGAFGGAAFHGVASGINYLADSRSSSTESDDSGPRKQDETRPDLEGEFAALRMSGFDNDTLSNVARDEIDKRINSKTVVTAPGAGSFKHTAGSATRNMNSMRTGTENIKKVFEYDDRSAQIVAKAFKTDVNTMSNMLYAPNADELINQYIKNTFGDGRGPTVVVGRNPDTKNGLFKVQITDVVSGDWFELNSALYTITGSDVDGDKSQVYFDLDSVNPIGWATDMFVNAETGKSNIDWAFSGFGKEPSDARKKTMNEFIDKLFANDPDRQKSMKSMLKSVWKADDFNTAFSTFLTRLGQEVSASGGNYHDAVQRFISENAADDETIIRQVARNAVNNTYSWDDVYDEVQQAGRAMTTRGSYGEAKTPIELYKALGLQLYIINMYNNGGFRQFGQIAYNDVKLQNAYTSALKEYHRILAEITENTGVSHEDVFRVMARASMRETRAGVNPSDTIEGVLDSMIIADTLSNAKVSDGRVSLYTARISTAADLDAVKSAFKESYKKYSKILEDAKKQLTPNGMESPLDTVVRNADLSDEKVLAEKFAETFSSTLATDLFNIESLSIEYKGKTVEQFLEPISKRGYIDPGIAAKLDQKVIDFIMDMAGNVAHKGSKIEKHVENIVDSIEVTKNIINKETGEIDINDRAVALSLVDMFGYLLGSKVAVNAGLLDATKIIKTKLGRIFIEGTTSQKLSSLVAVSWHEQFHDALEHFKDSNEEIHEMGLWELSELSRLSTTHALIVEQAIENKGESKLYDMLCNFNLSWETKKELFDTQFGHLDLTANLLVDSLTNEEGEFALSGMSLRIKNAQKSADAAIKMTYDRDKQQLNALKNRFETVGMEKAGDFVQFVMDSAKWCITHQDLDLLGAMAYDSTQFSNKAVEKAVMQAAGSQSHLSQQTYETGSVTAVIDDMTGNAFGVYLMSNWAQNRQLILQLIADENASFDIRDERTGRTITLTQEKLFKSVIPGYEKGSGITDLMMFKLLEKYPQLIGYLCDGKVQPGFSADGIPNVKNARTNGIEECYNAYKTRRDSANGNMWEVTRGIEVVGNKLLGQSWYRSYLVRCLDPDNIHEPEAVNRQMRSLHARASRAMYVWATQQGRFDSNGKFVFDLDNAYKYVNDARDRTFEEVWDSQLLDLNDALATGIDTINALSEAAQADAAASVSTGWSNTIYLESVNQWLSDHGLAPVSVDTGLATAAASSFSTQVNGQMSLLDVRKKQIEQMGMIVGLYQEYTGMTFHAGVSEDLILNLRTELKNLGLDDKKIDECLTQSTSDPEQFVNKIIAKSVDAMAGIPRIIKIDDAANFDLLTKDGRGQFWEKIVLPMAKSSETIELHNKDNIMKLLQKETVKKDANGKDVIDSAGLKKAIDHINRIYVAAQIHKTTDSVYQDINNDMFYQFKMFKDDAQNAIESLAKELKDNDLWYEPSKVQGIDEFYKSNYALPIADFTNPILNGMAMHVRVMDDAGKAPTVVSVNGAVVKSLAGYGYLSGETKPSAPPSKRLVRNYIDASGKILNLDSAEDNIAVDKNGKIIVDPNWAFSNNDSSWRFVPVSSVVGQMRNLGLDQQIWVFQLDENPHGIWETNTPASKRTRGKKYHHLSGCYLNISNYAQENLALKLKKRFASSKYTFDQKRNSNISKLENTTNVPADFAGFRNWFIGKRHEIARFYMNEFFDDGQTLDGLSYRLAEARLIAQSCTPGIRVNAVDANGVEQSFMLDASKIVPTNAQGEFDKFFADLRAQGYTVTDFSIFVASAKEQSFKIMRAVHKAADEARANGKVLSKADAGAIADAAMSDWSDMEFETIGVEEVMSHIPPVGYGHNHGVVIDSSRTANQYLVDALGHQGIPGTTGQAIAEFGNPGYMVKNGYRYQLGDDVANFIDYKRSGGIIANVYVEDSSPYLHDGEFAAAISGLKTETSEWAKYSANLVLSRNKIAAAVRNAAECGRAVIIPSEYYSYTINMPEVVGHKNTKLKMPSGMSDDFMVLEISSRKKALIDRGMGLPQSSISYANRDDYSIVLVDPQEQTTDAGIYINGKPGAGINFRNKELMIPFGSSKKLGSDVFFGRKAQNVGVLSLEDVKAISSEWTDHSNYNQLREVLMDNGFTFLGIKDRSEESTLRKIGEYFEWANGADVDADAEGIIRKPRGANQCVAILKGDTGNGTTFAPVLLSNTVPSQGVTYLDIDARNTDIVIGYSGVTDVFNGDYSSAKWSIRGETFKGIATLWEATHPGQPFPAFMYDNRYINFDAVISSETEKSRIEGRDAILLVDTLFNGSRAGLMNGSLLTKANDSHVIELNGKNYVKLKGWDKSDPSSKVREIDYTDAFWNDVANGIVELTSDDKTQSAIRKVVIACQAYGIAPQYILNMNGNYTGDEKTTLQMRHNLVFESLTSEEVLRFFHAIDPDYCPNGFEDGDASSGKYLFNQFGQIRITVSNGKGVYQTCRIQPNVILGDVDSMEVPGGTAGYSQQHMVARGLESGYLDSEMKRTIEYTDFLLGVPQFQKDTLDSRLKDYRDRKASFDGALVSFEHKIKAPYDGKPYRTYRAIKHERELRAHARTYMRSRPITVDGERIEYGSKEWNRVKRADAYLNDFLTAHGAKVTLTHNEIERILVNNVTGYTYNDGKGVDEISIEKYEAAIQQIIGFLDSSNPLPIKVTVDDSMTPSSGRYCIPLLPRETLKTLYENCDTLKVYKSYDSFEQAVLQEQEKAESIFQGITNDEGKRRALLFQSEYLRSINNMETAPGYLMYDMWIDDIRRSDDYIKDVARAVLDLPPETMAQWDAACERFNTQLQEQRKYLNDIHGKVEVPTKAVLGGKIVVPQISEAEMVNILLNGACDLTKVMGISNPGVLVGNMMDRGFHQSTMSFALRLGRRGKGPYATKNPLDQRVVYAIANNQDFFDMWIAIRQSAFNGEELELISQMKSANDVKAFLAEKKRNMTTFQKGVNRMYDVFSGGNFLAKQQIRNFVNRFAMFCEDDHALSWMLEKSPQDPEHTILEVQMMSNPAKFFADMLGANNDMTPAYRQVMNAMNWAKTGDMAQRNAIGVIISDLCKRSPAGKFFITTCISRFPQYGLNVTGRILNLVLPMSTLNYRFNEILAEAGYKGNGSIGQYLKNLNIQDVQIHRSLQEALMVDVTKMGVGAIACLLIGAAGILEPPDDDDKLGNIDEWLFCGQRVASAWWIQDMLGITLPYAAFMKSMMSGKIRLDLLTNGAAEACYSNPMIRIADATGFFWDPEGNFFSDYNEDVLAYQKAVGGPPSLSDFVQNNATSFGLSWVSQFFTPSVVKEWYNIAQDYEHSYKRIYAEGVTGTQTDPINGSTIETSYADAMLRRVTRKNPILGWLCNQVIHPETGYMAHEMPYTVYYDDAQLASREQWSVIGLSEEETEAKCFEIIGMLQQYNGNLEALQATGFSLDPYTKAMVSVTLWDWYHDIDEAWYEDEAAGYHNPYVAGNGDFNAGLEVIAQQKQWRNAAKESLSDLYYSMVKPMNTDLQVYRRYNTTYARDVNGEVYATGIHPGGILPFQSAPGRKADPEGTAGYYGDWNTISAVTGQPMLNIQRALVPWDLETEEWPDFEDWSADKSGNTYSSVYQQKTGDRSSTANTGIVSTPYGSNATGYPYGNYSYRSSGGYSRGGGGGGSYAPNIYSHATVPYFSNGGNLRASRPYNADLSYLRPDFETKGSREAYKRSDI